MVFNLGCGQRGQNYAAMALDFPERLKVPTGSTPEVGIDTLVDCSALI